MLMDFNKIHIKLINKLKKVCIKEKLIKKNDEQNKYYSRTT